MREFHIGRRVKELREREGVSLEELSNRTALDLSFLKEVEEGRKGISERNLRKIAEALETDVRNFFLQTDRDAALLQRSAMEKVRRAQARVEELGVGDSQLEGLLKGALGEMREVLKVIWATIPITEELEAELGKLTRTAKRLIRLLLESADEKGRFSAPKREIAIALHRSRRAVSAGVRELEASQLVSVERGGGRNHPNRYKVSDRLLRMWREARGISEGGPVVEIPGGS